MENICFIPATFHKVELEYSKSSENECSPKFSTGIIPTNTIAINTPQKIIIRDTTPVIPVCIAYMISDRRGSKYHHLSAKMTYIKKTGEDTEYSGEFIRKRPEWKGPPVRDPYHTEMEKERQTRIAEAQKYSDDELDDGKQVSGGYKNFDLLEYVDIPLTSGIYEIYMAFSGLESNRMQVEIVIENKADKPDAKPGEVKKAYSADRVENR